MAASRKRSLQLNLRTMSPSQSTDEPTLQIHWGVGAIMAVCCAVQVRSSLYTAFGQFEDFSPRATVFST